VLIKEVKRKLDGSLLSFDCTPILIESNRAIISHIWHRTTRYIDGPAYLPAEEIHTKAFFWTERDYVLYKLSSPSGFLYGYRIDAAEGILITQGTISWQDLILDFWISPKFDFHVLDEDELQAGIKNKLITPEQVQRVRLTEAHLRDNFLGLIKEIESC
jgi:predicted RNA-binding protein associated with RNAse of E/G family